MPRRFRPYHPDHSPDTEEISAAGESVTFLPQAEIDAASGDTKRWTPIVGQLGS